MTMAQLIAWGMLLHERDGRLTYIVRAPDGRPTYFRGWQSAWTGVGWRGTREYRY